MLKASACRRARRGAMRVRLHRERCIAGLRSNSTTRELIAPRFRPNTKHRDGSCGGSRADRFRIEESARACPRLADRCAASLCKTRADKQEPSRVQTWTAHGCSGTVEGVDQGERDLEVSMMRLRRAVENSRVGRSAGWHGQCTGKGEDRDQQMAWAGHRCSPRNRIAELSVRDAQRAYRKSWPGDTGGQQSAQFVLFQRAQLSQARLQFFPALLPGQ